MVDLSFSSSPLHNNSCVGVNLYILPELKKVITEAGLSVGDQYVVSKAISTSSVVAVCSCNQSSTSQNLARKRIVLYQALYFSLWASNGQVIEHLLAS